MANVALHAVASVLHVLLIVCCGAIIKYLLQIPPSSMTDLVRLGTTFFIPALVFSSIVSGVTAEVILGSWIVPISALLQAALISTLSYVTARCFVPEQYISLVVISSTFGNGMIIPLSVLRSLADQSENIAQNLDLLSSFAFIYSVFQSPFFWGISPILVTKSKQRKGLQKKSVMESQASAGLTMLSLAPVPTDERTDVIEHSVYSDSGILESVTLIHDERNDVQTTHAENTDPDCAHQQNVLENDPEPTSGFRKHFYSMKRKVYNIARRNHYIIAPLLNLPLMATLIGLFVALIPSLRDQMIRADGWLYIPFSALFQVGEGAISLVLVILGANLLDAYQNSNDCKLPLSVVIVSLSLKLLVSPILFVGFWFLARTTIDLSPYASFIVFVESASPMAINCSLIFCMQGFLVRESATLTLYCYVACVVTVSVGLYMYVWILGL